MNIGIEALKAPTHDTLDEWLNTPRHAKCGELFTPSKPMWWPDKTGASGINWQAAVSCVSPDWRRWLHAALAYRMVEVAQGTVSIVASTLSRSKQQGLDPMNENHLIDLRERFNLSEFASLVTFFQFWHECESLEQRPSSSLVSAYKKLPRKVRVSNDPILCLDPEKGPLNQVEQNALHEWLHEQFCHNNLDAEQYLYVRLLMVYGQRGCQIRMMVFDDFISSEKGHKIRIHWAKQRDVDATGFREKSEIFNLDADFYETVQHYKKITLAQLKNEYPDQVDWDKAIKHVPLFRRRLVGNDIVLARTSVPVLVEDDNLNALESGPQARFHAPFGSTSWWLQRMESMPGFPISLRTHRPLKITRGHRFKHTLGTDLSNEGLDEWSIARALMHSNTRTVRKYRQVSAELMAQIDEKMSDHLALVVNAFNGTIISDRASAKNGSRDECQIEDLAVCGADTLCHLDAPFSCYPCSKFQPLLNADHIASLERMERRRAQTIEIDKTTGVLWDRAILACRKVILDCKSMHESSTDVGG